MRTHINIYIINNNNNTRKREDNVLINNDVHNHINKIYVSTTLPIGKTATRISSSFSSPSSNRLLLLLRIIFLWILQQQLHSKHSNYYYYVMGEEQQQQSSDNTVIRQCDTDEECEVIKKRKGSVCLPEGICSNPFYKHGCLNGMMKNDKMNTTTINHYKKEYIRVCSSSDTTEAINNRYCIYPMNYQIFNYTEIRLMANNWESVYFTNWIIQIILSEISDIPTSIDTGYYNKNDGANFYNRNGQLDYGKAYDYNALRNASYYKDCRTIIQNNSNTNNISAENDNNNNENNYISCAHVSLEVWNSQYKLLNILQQDDIIEKPSPIGLLGSSGWYLPKFTGEADPTLLTSFGLIGEKNRHKLASMFLRPTTWYQYCYEISINNCTRPNNIAQRPPYDNMNEYNRMFVDGVYTGYFRNTSDNDCIQYPNNCTGHIADWPCGWSSFVEQQTYHMDIALRSNGNESYSNGYEYNQLTEMWQAANATNNHIIMMWWEPDAFMKSYSETSAAFTKITLPSATQECIENVVSPIDRCSSNVNKRIGSPKGSCDYPVEALQKIIIKNLIDICHSSQIAYNNPAYDVIKKFQLSSLQLGVMFDNWIVNNNNTIIRNDPRIAVCDWVINNFDIITSFIPRSYPRIIIDIDIEQQNQTSSISTSTYNSKDTLFYISYSISIIVIFFVLIVMGSVYKIRHRRIIIATRIEFLILLLIGLFIIQLGSLMMILSPPTTISCILSIWFVNIGYTLELTPLLIKITAIFHLQRSALQMKRVKVNQSNLLYAVAILTCFITLYLLAWSIIDPSTKVASYTLSLDDDNNNNVDLYGNTIVYKTYYCRSNNNYWSIGAITWRSILLLWATIMAFLTRSSPVIVNESRTLAIMIYAQFSFLIWSIIIFTLQDSISNTSYIAYYQSLIVSADVTAVCCIYIIPKLFISDDTYITNTNSYNRSSTGRFDHNCLMRWKSTPSIVIIGDQSNDQMMIRGVDDDDINTPAASSSDNQQLLFINNTTATNNNSNIQSSSIHKRLSIESINVNDDHATYTNSEHCHNTYTTLANKKNSNRSQRVSSLAFHHSRAANEVFHVPVDCTTDSTTITTATNMRMPESKAIPSSSITKTSIKNSHIDNDSSSNSNINSNINISITNTNNNVTNSSNDDTNDHVYIGSHQESLFPHNCNDDAIINNGQSNYEIVEKDPLDNNNNNVENDNIIHSDNSTPHVLNLRRNGNMLLCTVSYFDDSDGILREVTFHKQVQHEHHNDD